MLLCCFKLENNHIYICCSSCDWNQDKVVRKYVSKVQIIIPDSDDEEPNSNKPSPLPKQKDAGSSKTKVTTINKLTLYTDDLSHFMLIS
jgi:hypothetical protein